MAGQASAENGKKGGRPKGRKNAATLEKEKVQKEYQQKILRAAEHLFNKQLHLASGQTYLYKIEKELQIGPKGGKRYVKSKPTLVTEQWEIEAYLMGEVAEGDVNDDTDPDATYYFLTTEKPDGKALDSMLDRAFGKSAQSVDITSGGDKLPVLVKFIGNDKGKGNRDTD